MSTTTPEPARQSPSNAVVRFTSYSGGTQVFLASRPDLATLPVEAGMIAFPRLLRGEVDALCARLRDRYDTTVAPGRFFGLADHFRLALGCAPPVLAAGLERLGRALDEAP